MCFSLHPGLLSNPTKPRGRLGGIYRNFVSKTIDGNEAFSHGEFAKALAHFEASLSHSRKIFSMSVLEQDGSDDAVHTLIISRNNLAHTLFRLQRLEQAENHFDLLVRTLTFWKDSKNSSSNFRKACLDHLPYTKEKHMNYRISIGKNPFV
ncbi:MAG: hypothetical protein CFH41_00707 [Alphaproteobacteria bacterium MarineAlpha11_Bin1]|nr:MAG: hypothetical protein CFH41_00707 [Alphaproteobacteria bacterium MarineAlpha11_Bin1]